MKVCNLGKSLFEALFISFCIVLNSSFVAFAANQPDWKSLYKTKVQQIENEYKQGKRTKDDVYDTLFFSLQDFDFDGIPELYHTLIRIDKGDYELQEGTEEIYYIKNNKVVLGKIEAHSTLGLLPPYSSTNTLKDKRGQFALYKTAADKVCFITKDSWTGSAAKGNVRISELTFDSDKGMLGVTELIDGEYNRGAEPQSITGYELVGSGSYYSVSRLKDRDIWEWEAPYIIAAPVENDKTDDKTPDWSEAYRKFIADGKYANLKQKYHTNNSNKILFGLHDLDGDDTPELIIKNGAKSESDMVNYAYTYKNKTVTYIDEIGERDASFKYVPGYVGLYWESGNAGYYPGYYYSVENGKIKRELVAEEKVEYINSQVKFNKTQVTEDDKLYHACKNSDIALPMYSLSEINSMGWNTFVLRSMENDISLYLDVNRGSWCYDAVKYARDNNMMSGTSETEFEPESEITRAMVVTILYRMEKEPNTKQVKFKDVASGSWYADAVSWASQKGIANGVEKDKFAPDDNITREQLTAILYRYAEYKRLSVKFDKANVKCFIDNGKISDYAINSMSWAIGNGLISGTDTNHITPDGKATRAETAMILYRFCEKMKK